MKFAWASATGRAAGLVALAALVLLAGCGDPGLTQQEVPARPTPTIAAYDPDADVAAGKAALTLVPADATEVTVTDFDESRASLGVPDLTSDDLVTDRSDYWERARTQSVLLAEGMLREETSRLMLDYGFTQDDVDWEAHFTGPGGPGWVLAFRPDLDLAGVERAVADDVAGLGGAEVDRERHLVSVGAASDAQDSWGTIEGIADLASDTPAESTYYRAGCLSLAAVLGPDADVEDQEAVVAAHDPTTLAPLERFAVGFADGVATARLGPDRPDLFDRSELAAAFPTIGSLGFGDGFTAPVVDPSTGRIGYDVARPLAAATATLTGLLPFAVCNEVTPMEEPTGL
ncbi:hypothetical protein [Nocardioides currus]|uniref:hypothetical protein n=1 Tax=Nocardioides currus TaxID=2133958 RepID=UPI001403B68B|nr:hypothetical protein [Nocardioides currus]